MMKKTILTLSSVLFCVITFAQSVPQGINYQAVARDANGNELTNQTLTVNIGILTDPNLGVPIYIYSEDHQVTTNDFGLFACIIGEGTPLQGPATVPFGSIDWSVHYSLQVSINGLVMGINPFLSVPYSKYAQYSLSAEEGNTLDQAYDEGVNPGDGRIINADAGAVVINLAGATNAALDIETSGTGNGIRIDNSEQKDAIIIGNGSPISGWGSGIKIRHGGTGDGLTMERTGHGDGLYINQNGTGRSLVIMHQGAPTGTETAARIVSSSWGIDVDADSTAIIGHSMAMNYTEAGVRAQGMGHKDEASALEIKNGAIRVTGVNKPAGQILANLFFANPPNFIFSGYNMLTHGASTNCPNGGMLPLHNDHAIGSYDTFTFTNPLISANRSMLFLTIVEDGAYGTGTSHPNCTLTASIESISDGQAVIKVTLHGNPWDIMGATPKINYLIINE